MQQRPNTPTEADNGDPQRVAVGDTVTLTETPFTGINSSSAGHAVVFFAECTKDQSIAHDSPTSLQASILGFLAPHRDP